MTLRIEGSTGTADDKKEITESIRAISGVKYVRADMEREKGVYDYDIETDGKTDIRRDINSLCADKGWNILMLQLSDLTLEDIFLKITMGDEVVRSENDEDTSSKPRIDIKVSPNGKLRAVKEADSSEEAKPEETTDSENNGGEE